MVESTLLVNCRTSDKLLLRTGKSDWLLVVTSERTSAKELDGMCLEFVR